MVKTKKKGNIPGLSISEIKEIRQDIKNKWKNHSKTQPFSPCQQTLYKYKINEFAIQFQRRKFKVK